MSRTHALIDLNVLESIREFGRWQEGAMLLEEDGLLLLAGASESPTGYSNAAARVSPQVPAELVLERAAEFFGDQQRGFALWVRGQGEADLEAAAERAGLSSIAQSAWMAREAPLPEAALPPGVRIELVEDAAGIEAAKQVNRAAYVDVGFSPEDADAIYGVPARALGPQLITAVAYRGEQPLATAMALLTPGVAGIYWVGTDPAARRKGLGAACTTAVHNAGLAAGARLSALHATRMGEPLYASLGYRTISFHRWYLKPA
jgi:GNAT superfamily N-acetyltransferase